MNRKLALAIIGEYNPAFPPHAKTREALEQAGSILDLDLSHHWISTEELEGDAGVRLAGFDGIWVAPGSPYRSLNGALKAIRFGREGGIPVLGTCGGCQHMVIEYARNVLGFRDAQHAEYDPYASELFVTPLSCSLVGKAMDVLVQPESLAGRLYGQTRVREQYYCNFGINPAHQRELHEAGFQVVGVDTEGEARILELPAHPFFIATLFVPQLIWTRDNPHPLIMAFVRAALASQDPSQP